jgi:hypothetical protein
MVDPDDDVARLLRAARQLPRSVDDDLAWVWEAAALDPASPAAKAAFARMAQDGRAMLEFGIASNVLAGRGRASAEGAASAEAVLAGLRRRRFALHRALPILVSLAAAALLVLWLWSRPGGIDWAPCEVVRVASRGGDAVAFRLRLSSPVAWSPVVFLCEADPTGTRIDRVHPLAPALAASPSFRTWPPAELPAASDIVLPPPPFDRLQFASGSGYVLIVHGSGVADGPGLAATEAEVRAQLASRPLDDAAIAALVATARQRGASVEVQRVQLP